MQINCKIAWELGWSDMTRLFFRNLKRGSPGACVWNIKVGDQRRVPQGIAVLYCIAKLSEDTAVQAAFPCCRAEGLWERPCAQQPGSLLLRPTLRFHFMHLAKQACSFTLSRYFYISVQMLVEDHLFGFKPELKFPTNVWRQNQKGKYFSQNQNPFKLRVVNPLNSNGV